MTTIARKKLIEVSLPLKAINEASVREKSIRHGHPSTLHLWWARRPLATARAVIFAQMVDDPSACPDEFPTAREQEVERERLFRLLEELVVWENSNNEKLLARAHAEIVRSWQRACRDNANHPDAATLFNPSNVPALHDPFAGGGSIPLEAQRLGLQAYASDLNPVAVLINKAMIEIPPRFANRAAVNPAAEGKCGMITWNGAQGLADDVRYYGSWMREEAQRRIGHLYPTVTITEEMAKTRPDLKRYVGRSLTVIAWLWARTVKSPNPAFRHVDVPLAATFMLSTKPGKEAYVEPVKENDGYRFEVKVGKPPASLNANSGTKTSGKNGGFSCLLSGTPISFDYVREEGKAKRLGSCMLAMVLDGDGGRIYLGSDSDLANAINIPLEEKEHSSALPARALGFRVQEYGMLYWDDLFTPRQLTALNTFSMLVSEARDRAVRDAVAAGLADDGVRLEDGGSGAAAYGDAVATYLAFAVDKCADYWSSICTWHGSRELIRNTFGRQAIPMTWDFAEANPCSDSSGGWAGMLGWVPKFIGGHKFTEMGTANQAAAQSQHVSINKVVSTDPPYYDNIGYADLSDFLYVWLRRSLRDIFPSLLATVAVPKDEELVATPFRHGGKKGAEQFFLAGMRDAMANLAIQAHPAFPITIYYAFKQSKTDGDGATGSTGWETFLDAVISAGLGITGTWPMRTEMSNRMIGMGTNALASSIVLVCHRRAADLPIATRREFQLALKREMCSAIRDLQQGGIAPVDMQQAAIGPGMAVYSRYRQVIDTNGSPLTVGDVLRVINRELDEVLGEQESDFDPGTIWALNWFRQHGFDAGLYGEAETLSKAKNVSVEVMVNAGIAEAVHGKVRLLQPNELRPLDDIGNHGAVTVWEALHQLVHALERGETAAAEVMKALGPACVLAKELPYRLYLLCERGGQSKEGQWYNELIQSWQEIARLAKEEPSANPQGAMEV